MTIKQIVNKRNLIIIGAFVLVLAAVNVFSLVSRSSNAEETQGYTKVVDRSTGVINIQYNNKLINNQETSLAQYLDITLNMPTLNYRNYASGYNAITGFRLSLRTSPNADEYYSEEINAKVGNNTFKNIELNDVIYVKIEGIMRFTDAQGAIQSTTVDMTRLGASDEVYKNDVTITETSTTREKEDNKTVGYTEYIVPQDGTYNIQLWGAQGSYFPITNEEYAGKGAYTSGNIQLKKGTVLYFYVGDSKNGADCSNTNTYDNANTANRTVDAFGNCYYSTAFNGGGATVGKDGGHAMSSGGGATDVRYFGANYTPTAEDLKWDSTLGLNSRIMVAGGGGGTLQQSNTQYNFKNVGIGGAGGALTGYAASGIYSKLDGSGVINMPATANKGGTQTSGGQGGGTCKVSQASGAFGIGGDGGNAIASPDNLQACIDEVTLEKQQLGFDTSFYIEPYLYTVGNIGAGGGGGYYGGGGGSSLPDCHSGGAGGSSYISGYTGSIAIASSTDRTPKCTTSSSNSCSVHYSNMVFTDGVMKDGKSTMPSKNNKNKTTVGNSGNGAYSIYCVDCEAPEENVQSVILQKYGKTTSGAETTTIIAGAIFELYSASGSKVNTYTTDEAGQIVLYSPADVVAGKSYYFVEKTAPKGYEIDKTPIKFTVDNDNNSIQTFKAYNKQKTGSVILKKLDVDGYSMSGVTFALYKENGDLVKAGYVTNNRGEITVEGLDFGKYYFLETATIDGYELSTDHYNFTITANSVETAENISVQNHTKPGKVQFTKYNKDMSKTLKGAVYNLYSGDGTLLRENLTTDNNGQILIDKLYWGSYYLKEVTAPAGYGVSEEFVRFAVNNENVDIVQQISAKDREITKNVTITKKIKTNDIVWSHGEATFIFKLTGKDFNNKDHTYYQEITFTQTDVNNYLAANPNAEYVLKSVKISGIVSGTYTLTEEETLRYEVEKISDVVSGQINGNSVIFDLTNDAVIDGYATYQNKKIDQDSNLTHETVVTNVIKACTKITYLDVKYNNTKVTPGDKINKNNITAKVYYDDGTTSTLKTTDYTLSADTIPTTATTSYGETLTYKDPCSGTFAGTFTVPLNPNPYHKVFITQSTGGIITVKNTTDNTSHTTDFIAKEGDKLVVTSTPDNKMAVDEIKINGSNVADKSTYTMGKNEASYTVQWKSASIEAIFDDGYKTGTRGGSIWMGQSYYDTEQKSTKSIPWGTAVLKTNQSYSGTEYTSVTITGKITTTINSFEYYNRPGVACVNVVFIAADAIAEYGNKSAYDYFYPNKDYPVVIDVDRYRDLNVYESTNNYCQTVTNTNPSISESFTVSDIPFPGPGKYYIGIQGKITTDSEENAPGGGGSNPTIVLNEVAASIS